ncbi:unnamed protein product [Meloidogyne enterolobii]|uniref:Uncharacterized protein n=1 Tax=Meloidogyne enterolobii TaxID=390850 RepID=A0ACB0YK21_MELEN
MDPNTWSEDGMLHDNSGVFYSVTTEGSSTEKHEFHSLCFHHLGTDSKEDVLVYERRDDPGYFTNAWVSDDGKFLFITCTWDVIIEEDPKRKLDWAMVVDGNKLLVCYMEDVKLPWSHALRTEASA